MITTMSMKSMTSDYVPSMVQLVIRHRWLVLAVVCTLVAAYLFVAYAWHIEARVPAAVDPDKVTVSTLTAQPAIEGYEQPATAGPVNFTVPTLSAQPVIEVPYGIIETHLFTRKSGPLEPEICRPGGYCVDQLNGATPLDALALPREPVLPRDLGRGLSSLDASSIRLDDSPILPPLTQFLR